MVSVTGQSLITHQGLVKKRLTVLAHSTVGDMILVDHHKKLTHGCEVENDQESVIHVA
jgi:hypothetical protein